MRHKGVFVVIIEDDRLGSPGKALGTTGFLAIVVQAAGVVDAYDSAALTAGGVGLLVAVSAQWQGQGAGVVLRPKPCSAMTAHRRLPGETGPAQPVSVKLRYRPHGPADRTGFFPHFALPP